MIKTVSQKLCSVTDIAKIPRHLLQNVRFRLAKDGRNGEQSREKNIIH